MPIGRIGKFLETDDLGIAHSLGIESSHLDECISEIRQRNIQGVFGCPYFGFMEENLNFLAKVSNIRQVWFWEINLKDITGLYEQENLEYFGVSTKRPPINFSAFKNLREAVWHPVNKDSGLEELSNLSRLDIWRYKQKDMGFSALRVPTSLRKLKFNWCNQESVMSLPPLPHVEELQFHYCRNLKSLDGLMSIAPNLKKLVVTRCANLESFEEVLRMPLENVYINIRGKEVANLSFKRDALKRAP